MIAPGWTRLPNGAEARVVEGPRLDAATRAELVALFEASFGTWPRFEVARGALEHLDWKLAGPSRDEPTLVTLVRMDGRLVGATVNVRERALALGREVVLKGGGDECTHPAFQGRGIHNQRRDFERDALNVHFDGALVFSRHATIRGTQRRLGSPGSPGNRVRLLVRVLDARVLAGRPPPAFRRVPAAVRRAGLELAGHARLPAGSSRSLRIEPVARFDARFDALFREAASGFDVLRVRGSDYLEWRFADPRGGSHPTLAALEGDTLLGYVVTARTGPRGSLADLLVRPGRADAASVLVQAALERLAAEGAAVVEAWSPRRHPYRRILRRHGFWDVHHEPGAAYNVYRRPGGAPLDVLRSPRAALHVSLGDSDWV